MDHFVLLDPLTGAEDPLRVGRNFIGRSATPMTDGSSFIGLQSTRSAISRLQAVIDVAANGDAWLMDHRSTNGTFLARGPGTGLRLEADRFYQLLPGARVTFGDVERHFVAGTVAAAEGAMALPAAAEGAVALPAEGALPAGALPTAEGAVALPAEGAMALPAEGAMALPAGALPAAAPDAPLSGSSRQSAPYLEPDGDTPPRPKRPRSPGEVPPPRPLALCFSGMDAEERARAQRRGALCGARPIDSVLEADVLIVKSPVTRTPKFIIAVARGIPVVTEDFLKDADLAHAEKYVPTLRHGTHMYSAATLRKVIFRKDKTPTLSGKSFSVSELPTKLRAVTREIIIGCGGGIPRRPLKGTISLIEESLDELYDKLLRGKS